MSRYEQLSMFTMNVEQITATCCMDAVSYTHLDVYKRQIDYSANYKPMTIDYKMLKAENMLDAMNEAEQYMDKETVLSLIHI